MKAGQSIRYVDAVGTVHDGTIVSVGESGASGGKILDLTVDDVPIAKVCHVGDQADSEGYWLLLTEAIKAPETTANVNEPPFPASRRSRVARAEAASDTSTDQPV